MTKVKIFEKVKDQRVGAMVLNELEVLPEGIHM
jgi:hypothetical protein